MNDQLEKPQTVETLEPFERSSPNAAASAKIVSRARPSHSPEPHPVAKKPPVARTAYDDNEEVDDSFIGRHRAKLAIAAVLAIGAGVGYLMTMEKSTRPYKAPERMISIQVPPPPAPPPPPPPPKIQPPPEQKMIEQAPVEEKPPEPKPVDEPPPTLGTNIKGDGPGSIPGLGTRGDNSRIGGNGTGSGRGGGKWDGFARQVQSRIADAVRNNPKTRAVSIRSLQIRIWVDATGRITRAKLMGSTGDSALDSALQNEVLNGLQLKEPPPPGMPSPIVLRISSRRPT
jgi:periplasmic protein TonB